MGEGPPQWLKPTEICPGAGRVLIYLHVVWGVSWYQKKIGTVPFRQTGEVDGVCGQSVGYAVLLIRA